MVMHELFDRSLAIRISCMHFIWQPANETASARARARDARFWQSISELLPFPSPDSDSWRDFGSKKVLAEDQRANVLQAISIDSTLRQIHSTCTVLDLVGTGTFTRSS